MNKYEISDDNLRDTHWIGEVVDNQDPLSNGRCRVKVIGKFDALPTSAIPWATPMNRDHVGAHSIPRIGDIVAVRFDNGNLYHPEYWFQIDQNKDLKKEVLEASSEPYNVVSLVYDNQRHLRIYYSPEDGLVISSGKGKKDQPMIRFDKDGNIFINSDNIYIASTPNDKKEPAVKGQTLTDTLKDMIATLQSHVHAAPGTPMLPNSSVKLSAISAKLDQIKQTKQ